MNTIDLIRWTAANQRARDDYYAHPTRACPSRRPPGDGTCWVTTWGRRTRPCGQPVVAGRLCARHEADRVRLGGAA